MEPDEVTDAVFPESTGADPGDAPLRDEAAHGDVRPIDKFRQTAAGSVVAAGLLGLRDALEGRPEREEVAIVSEAPDQPAAGVTLVFDEDDPSRLRVVLPRPPESSSD